VEDPDEHTIPAQIMEGLTRLGHTPRWSENPIGTAQAIWIDQARGVLIGGADGRRCVAPRGRIKKVLKSLGCGVGSIHPLQIAPIQLPNAASLRARPC
jgi:hypothetical protein